MKPARAAQVGALLAVLLICQSGEGQPPSSAPTICIDPGHPSEVNSGLTLQNGTTETHIDWVVALKLRRSLEAHGYRVVMTKETEGQLVRNKERALIANRARSALAVRLHCDTGAGRGYAVYFPDRQGKKEGKTGPSPEIMRKSRQAAEAMDASMAESLQGALKNNGVRGDSQTLVGSKQGALTGSIFSEVPILTIEMVVLKSPGDAAWIKTDAGQQRMAQAIANGVSRFVPYKPAL